MVYGLRVELEVDEVTSLQEWAKKWSKFTFAVFAPLSQYVDQEAKVDVDQLPDSPVCVCEQGEVQTLQPVHDFLAGNAHVSPYHHQA